MKNTIKIVAATALLVVAVICFTHTYLFGKVCGKIDGAQVSFYNSVSSGIAAAIIEEQDAVTGSDSGEALLPAHLLGSIVASKEELGENCWDIGFEASELFRSGKYLIQDESGKTFVMTDSSNRIVAVVQYDQNGTCTGAEGITPIHFDKTYESIGSYILHYGIFHGFYMSSNRPYYVYVTDDGKLIIIAKAEVTNKVYTVNYIDFSDPDSFCSPLPLYKNEEIDVNGYRY